MKDCPECHAGDVSRAEWSLHDGEYPVFSMRELRKEHSYCGLRMGNGDAPWERIMFRRGGTHEHVGTLIHHGRK
jgi:hypothetical protein